NSDGSLDPSFDGDGLQTIDFLSYNDQAYGVAVQSDGKIVLAGYSVQPDTNYDFAGARLKRDGSLDPSLGAAGRRTTHFDSAADEGSSVAVQFDGKIVLAGFSYQGGTGSDFAVALLNNDGSLDPSFGTEGRVTTDFGSDRDVASGVAVQSDGKIVVGGQS